MKKTVWLNVSIDLEVDGTEHDDDLFMEYANDVAAEAGFIVDDMGVIDVEEEDAPASPPPPVGMDIYERTACAEYLTAFPNDKTFDEVLQMLEDGDEEVLVWEAFEDHTFREIEGFVRNLSDHLRATFIPRKEAK